MESLLSHCIAIFSEHYGLFAVFFMGGLTGGFTHCLAMCGAGVAGQSACAAKCGNNIGNATQISYHLGRLTTYGALGFFAALLSKQIATFPFWSILSSVMLFVAGVMFIASSLKPRAKSVCGVSGKSNYLRGAFMGFMPCGLLYAALMMAATLANPIAGMVAMWIFTLGTIPALLIASLGADFFGRKKQEVMYGIGRAMMAFNGVSLLVMATRIMR